MGYQMKLIAIGKPTEGLAATVNRLLHMHRDTPVDSQKGIAIDLATFADIRSASDFATLVGAEENEHLRQAIRPATNTEVNTRMAEAATGQADMRTVMRGVIRGFNGSAARLDELLADCAELGSDGFVLYLV